MAHHFPWLSRRLRWRIGSHVAVMAAFFVVPAGAVPPAAPSNFSASVTLPDANTMWVRWTWQDNSNDEEGFDIEYSLTSGSGFNYLASAASNTTALVQSLTVGLSEGTSLYFRGRAYKGAELSEPSNEYRYVVPAKTFVSPGPVGATAITDNQVMLSWRDNSTTEEAFYIEMREMPGGSFIDLGWVWFYTTNVTISGYFDPEKDYEFHVRAGKGSPVQYTAYSDPAAVHIPFLAPGGLTATATGEKSVQLQWQDNSQNEDGYAIEARIQGGTGWERLFYVAANATSVTLDAADLPYPNTTYEFRVLAAFQASAADPIIDSDPSNVASATTPFHAPSNLQAVPATDTIVNLTWEDNSQVEEGYEILVRAAGDTQWTAWAYAVSNATALAPGGLPPGTALEFAVRAFHETTASDVIYSGISPVASATTKDGFLGRDYEPIQLGAAFSYQVQTTSQAPRTSITVGTLPDGLSYNPGTAVISGTPTVSGIFQVPMQAVFDGGWADDRTMTLRIVRPAAPPLADAPITDQTLPLGGNATVPLANKFSDPDTETAVRMSTSLGDIDIVLFPSVTPQTVTNFLGYAGRGDYGGVSIHRSVPGFVVQGGGYETNGAPKSFTRIPTQPSPPNEPGVSNVRGTIAMAKRAGDPNSATSEFFFNLADNNDPGNPSSLDNQNGGFTAFGRAAAPGMAVVDAIAALPRGDYVIDLDGSDASFDDWPMDAGSAPPTMDQSKLVLIESVAPVSPLSYSVTSNSNPTVASAVINGGQIELSGLEPGQSTITVTATDLDGNTVSQTFDIMVTQSFGQWASRTGFPGGLSGPGDDGDRDGSCNLNEFAFLTDPMLSDGVAGRPVIALSGTGGGGRAKITFRLRKFTSALSYRVESSTNLVSWETVWRSDEGLSLPHVQAEDHGDHHLVTVEDPDPPPGAPGYFLRVVTTSTAP